MSYQRFKTSVETWDPAATETAGPTVANVASVAGPHLDLRARRPLQEDASPPLRTGAALPLLAILLLLEM